MLKAQLMVDMAMFPGLNSGGQLLELAVEGLRAVQGNVPAQVRFPDEAVDRKFIILAINPVTGKVYTERDAILLCAKDAAVPAALSEYAFECKGRQSNLEHIESIYLLKQRVEAFQQRMGGGRVPDTVGAEIPRCLDGDGL